MLRFPYFDTAILISGPRQIRNIYIYIYPNRNISGISGIFSDYMSFFILNIQTEMVSLWWIRGISEIHFGRWVAVLLFPQEMFLWILRYCVDLLGAELFLYFSHILLNFWMTIYVFAFRKLNNMSPVKPAFYFLTDFILDALIAMCPKSLYYPYN